MTTIQLSIVCITVLLIVLALVGNAPKRPARSALLVPGGADVALHLGDGQSIRGKVISCDNGIVIVEAASLIAEGGTTKLAGTARLPESEIKLVQAL